MCFDGVFMIEIKCHTTVRCINVRDTMIGFVDWNSAVEKSVLFIDMLDVVRGLLIAIELSGWGVVQRVRHS